MTHQKIKELKQSLNRCCFSACITLQRRNAEIFWYLCTSQLETLLRFTFEFWNPLKTIYLLCYWVLNILSTSHMWMIQRFLSQPEALSLCIATTSCIVLYTIYYSRRYTALHCMADKAVTI